MGQLDLVGLDGFACKRVDRWDSLHHFVEPKAGQVKG